MSDDAPALAPIVDDDGERLGTFDAALDAIIFHALALTSAIASCDCAGADRERSCVKRAFARAMELAECLLAAPERTVAWDQLRRLRQIAPMMLESAPAPTAVVIAQAHRGHMWSREEQPWIAGQQARGPRPPLPQRRHRDTQPDTPTALRDAAAPNPVLVCEPSRDNEGSR